MKTIRRAAMAMALSASLLSTNALANSDLISEATVLIQHSAGSSSAAIVNSERMEAQVLAIDYDERIVKLRLEDGEERSVQVGPAAVNFNQIKPGDVIRADLTEEVVLTVAEPGTIPADGYSVSAVGSEPGEAPGGLVFSTAQISATILGVSPKYHRILLGFDDGTEKLVKVHDSVDLSVREYGEKVVLSVSEMVAISVK